MFVDEKGEFGLAHLFPTPKAYLLPLTRRGFFSEFTTLLNGYAFALYKRRHLFAEIDKMNVVWADLLETRPQYEAGLSKELYPARSRISLKVGAREHFEDMRRSLLHARAAPRIKLPQIGFKGTLEHLMAKLAQGLFVPRREIRKSAKRKMAALEINDQQFYAVHMRGGDKVEGDANHGPVKRVEGERADHAAFMRPILAEDPAPVIFVLTDDYREVQALREGYPQARIVTLCPPESQGYFQDAYAAQDLAKRTADVAQLFEEVLIANRAKGFFGPYLSNVSQFIHLLRYPRPSASIDSEREWTPFRTLPMLPKVSRDGSETARADASPATRMPAMDRLGQDGAIEIATTAKKHVLELSGYVRCVSPAAAAAPDILLLSAANYDPEAWIRDVPEAIWSRVAMGATRVVFDASAEGVAHHEDLSRRLHKFMASRGAEAQTVVYLTQDRGYGAEYDAWLAAHKRRDGFRVLYADYFIRKFFMGVERSGPDLFEQRLKRFQARSPERERRFICLNQHLRESKLYFLTRLLRDGLWPQGFISYGGLGMNREGKTPSYRMWPDEMAAMQPYVEQLEAKGRIMLGEVRAHDDPNYRAPVHDVDMPEHDRSWFSVVTETEMRSRPSRITEKPLKALVNFHPLIFLGNPGSLPLLRELGFRSFNGFFDEAYDEILDPKARFEHVYEQVAALCAAQESDLARRSHQVDEALIHNAWWGLTQLPEVYLEKKDLELLTAILN